MSFIHVKNLWQKCINSVKLLLCRYRDSGIARFGEDDKMVNFTTKQREKEINKVLEISVSLIKPNPSQPRKHFYSDELTKLAKSISQEGILQPLIVRINDGEYELVSGERRLRAAKIAGLKTVPCIIVNMTERNSALMALIENIQREDLSFFEEAGAIQSLISVYGMTQEDAAIRLGIAQSTVANKLRLLKIPGDEQQVIMDMGLSERHARALLKLKSKSDRVDVLERIHKYKLNVEMTEAYISKLLEGKQKKESYKKRSPVLKDVRLFVNTINKAIEVMRLSGVEANSRKTQTENEITYTITIPINENNSFTL